uniref:Uncharacterized protein n=1 Tax=Tanacetum cinerariifolium TaxID=118510 RepID=A0A699IGH5_TANCI|nr:hypothetical protein [Tanacetum cinerariifolium]
MVNLDYGKTKVNFWSRESDVGNVDADFIIPIASVQEVNDKFANSFYGYFIRDGIAYPLVEKYVWSKRSNFACALIELDAACLLKDKLVVAIPSQGKRQVSGFNKSTNRSYRAVVKPKSSTPVSNPFSTLEEENCYTMDDLVDDRRKKVEALLRKTVIWLGKKAERNIVFSPEAELHYFDRDVLEFANMDQVVEEAEHGNVPSDHG